MTSTFLIASAALASISFVNNVLWAFYIKNVSDDNRFKASIFGELIVLGGAAITYNYVHDAYLIIPTIIGGFLGTYFSSDIKKFLHITGKENKQDIY